MYNEREDKFVDETCKVERPGLIVVYLDSELTDEQRTKMALDIDQSEKKVKKGKTPEKQRLQDEMKKRFYARK